MSSDGSPESHVIVFESNDQSALAVAESILRDAGIPTLQQEEGAGAPPWPNVKPYGMGVYLLLVSPKDADDARTLLADLARPGTPADLEEPEEAEVNTRLTAGPRQPVTVGRYLILGFLALVLLLFLASLWPFIARIF